MKEVLQNTFIFEHQALDPDFCQHVIDKFEADPNKKEGTFGVGTLNADFKSSTDLTDLTIREDWKKESEAFILSLQDIVGWFEHNYVGFEENFDCPGLRIQRTEPGQKYNYHVDIGPAEGVINRQLAIIWYLNTVPAGGETEFSVQGVRIKPEVGKVAVFPPFWTHAHRGLSPEDCTKYICTTWIRLRM